MIKKLAFIGFLFLVLFKPIDAQKKYTLSILNKSTNNDIQYLISYKKNFSDTLQRLKELQSVVLFLWKEGYVSASCDSTVSDSLNLVAFIDIGIKFKYLLVNNINSEIISSGINFHRKKVLKRSFTNYSELQEQIIKLILFYENMGFPFVNVKFDSIIINDSCFSGKFILDRNTEYTLDSIVIKGTASPSVAFIKKYLGVKNNSLYNEASYSEISKKIKELNFVKETKPFEIEFYENKAKLILYTDKVKANQFDGIIGFMPNNESGKLLVTGDVKLLLVNSFNRGELIAFKWQKFDKLSQDLKITFNYPYLLSSPFGIDIDFSLYKKDTSFITTKGNIGFKYIFEGNNHLKAFYEKQSTSLLSENSFRNDTMLPVVNASKLNAYGLEMKMQDLDRLTNPRKGYYIKLIASTGNKELLKSKGLPDIVYKDIKLRSSQYMYDAEISCFVAVLKRSCIYLNTKSALIYNNYLFDNEVYRIGGLKTLRGFDEESILATFYTIFTLEYRYLFDEYSYLNVFWNGCHFEKNTINKYTSGNPFGFGAGINFKTKLGVFSINYALGKNEKDPIYFKKAKIHFGIINYF